MAANNTKKDVAGVPYTSFKTLLNTADRMKEEGGAPSRVDRSYLSNMPGGERGIFTTGLKALGLVTDDLEPTDDFHALVEADEDGRKEIVGRIAERVYPGPLSLPKRATQQQLETSFREYGITGSTLRRAIGFFLAAADFAGIERSANWKLPKRERPVKPKTPIAPTPKVEDETPTPPKADPPVLPPASGRHPFIEGLFRELPEPGEAFPSSKQKAWFDTATGIFKLIYKTDAPEAEPGSRVTPSVPESGGGESG